MMKTNKDTLRSAMDRRLSFLDDLPSCRAGVLEQIAREEEPVMKKKVSAGFVFAIVLVMLSAAALAAGLLFSPRVSAARSADQALEKEYGITREMQTFFGREEEELPEGGIRVTYTGAGNLAYPLGTYTVTVRDGKADVTWSHEGKDTSGGYDSEVWGTEQLKQMFAESTDESKKRAFLDRAAEIAEANEAAEDNESSEADEGYHIRREAGKTAALRARKLSEEEMIGIGREFIVSNYELDEEQISRLELYTNSFRNEENEWYETVNEKPCFLVEYLLYEEYAAEQQQNGEARGRTEKDGYYKVYVNVENGAVEEYEYNSALGGEG